MSGKEGFQKQIKKIREETGRYLKKGTAFIENMEEQVNMKYVMMDLHWCTVTVSPMGMVSWTGMINRRRRRWGGCTTGNWTGRGRCVGKADCRRSGRCTRWGSFTDWTKCRERWKHQA